MNSTPVEKQNEDYQREQNLNDEDESYYYNKALKISTKTDAGATRSKGRIPIWKLNLDNENEIPQMPSDILEKPNDKHYEKELATLDQQIKHHEKSIEETKEKIKAEKYGNSPEITKLNEEKGPLKEKRDLLDKQIKELESKVEGPKRQLNELRAQKDSLAKEVDFTKLEVLNAEIRSIQQKLGFSTLSVSEEKKLIEKKTKLEEQKPKVQKLNEMNAQIKELNNSNSDNFNKLRQLYDEKKPISERLRKVIERLDSLYKNSKENDPNIKNLELIKNSIQDDIRKCVQKKREINKEWNDKWYNYEEQQKLITYIKEAVEAISKLKKKEEKERKRREKAAKKEVAETEETIQTPLAAVKLYEYEIELTKWLIGYFKNLAGIKATTENSQVQQSEQKPVSSKLDEDLKKGLLKEMSSKVEDDPFSMATSSTTQNKKKTKGPKVSKREQKSENSNAICLDIEVARKIKDIGLNPPALKTELPGFLATLEKTHENYVRKSEPVKDEPSKVEEIKPVTETAPQENIESHTETHVETVVENEGDNVTKITVTTTIVTTTEAKDADDGDVVEEVVEETEIIEETTEN